MSVDITGNLTIKRSNDPIGFVFVIALTFHAFVILSISFDISREKPPAPERTLDITLVQPKPDPKPAEDADFLAQQSQQGGGRVRAAAAQTATHRKRLVDRDFNPKADTCFETDDTVVVVGCAKSLKALERVL